MHPEAHSERPKKRVFPRYRLHVQKGWILEKLVEGPLNTRGDYVSFSCTVADALSCNEQLLARKTIVVVSWNIPCKLIGGA